MSRPIVPEDHIPISSTLLCDRRFRLSPNDPLRDARMCAFMELACESGKATGREAIVDPVIARNHWAGRESLGFGVDRFDAAMKSLIGAGALTPLTDGRVRIEPLFHWWRGRLDPGFSVHPSTERMFRRLGSCRKCGACDRMRKWKLRGRTGRKPAS